MIAPLLALFTAGDAHAAAPHWTVRSTWGIAAEMPDGTLTQQVHISGVVEMAGIGLGPSVLLSETTEFGWVGSFQALLVAHFLPERPVQLHYGGGAGFGLPFGEFLPLGSASMFVGPEVNVRKVRIPLLGRVNLIGPTASVQFEIGIGVAL